MNKLLPVGKGNIKKQKKNEGISGGKLGKSKESKKSKPQPAEVGLSRNQTLFLSLIVVGLSLTVFSLSFWVSNLTTQNSEKELVINRLTQEIELAQNKNAIETPQPTLTYGKLPSDPSPDTSEETVNPDVAEIQKFNFEEIFDNSEILISQNQKKSYYICNEKAALRLIEDSGLKYLISKNPDLNYNVLLLGDYEPKWVNELAEWEERKNRLLTTVSEQSTASNDPANPSNVFKMPEELEGLEAVKQEYLVGIQILSSSSRDEVNKKVWILRNEDIPAYIYSYPKNYSTAFQYTLQIDMFPGREDAKEYQIVLNREYRDFYLEMISNDVTRGYPRNIMSNE